MRALLVVCALLAAACEKEPQYVPVDLGKRVPKAPFECTAPAPLFPVIPDPPFPECPDQRVMCPVAQARYMMAVHQWRREMLGDRKICRAYVQRIVAHVNQASK